MSVVNLFTRSTPTINGYEFDAILEDTLEASAELTGYTVETGVRSVDHRIINPIRWSLIGAVSNNPISISPTDFVGALVPDANAEVATVAGLGAGFLSGGDDTRGSAVLDILMKLLNDGTTFDVDAGDRQLKNMTIVKLRRTSDAENEGGLIFEAELQELPTLETVANIMPTTDVLNFSDPSYSQSSATVDRGMLA